jgi:2-polyprenyl-3-methyl-5-hydroxy-6-metoxy-1,4-benzoquinol methylase
MPVFINNQCPVCESHEFSIIGKSDLGTVMLADKPDKSEIVKCKNCKTIYVNPFPVWYVEDFAILYNIDYFPETDKWAEIREHVNIKRRFERIKKDLKTENKNCMEFGAGIQAYMAKYLDKQGWNIDLQEPAEDFSKILKKTYSQFNVITSDFLNMNTQKKYSLIYADSVLEHVHNPVEYIKKSAQMLDSGGILYLIFPHEHSLKNWGHTLINKINGKAVAYLAPYKNPYHLIGFSKKGIKIMAEKAGLQFVRHIKRDDYESFHFLRRKKGLLKYPIACVLYLADLIGRGTNQEIILRKN